MLSFAFFQPDMAGNLGAGLRLAACLGAGVDVIEPCGFPMDDRRLRRAAMDYAALPKIRRHRDWSAFTQTKAGDGSRVLLLSRHAGSRFDRHEYRREDTLLVGRETSGVPEEVRDAVNTALYIPMAAGARSLNVVIALAMVAGEAMRQVGGFNYFGAIGLTLEPNLKNDAKTWFESLRDRICKAFEDLEDRYTGPEADTMAPGRFEFMPWDRPEGGGGVIGLMRGRVFEKVGVNVSTVWGQFDPKFAGQIPGTEEDPSFWASGISLVAHLRNPHAPPAHMNTRHIRTQKTWFGGGADLNPIYPIDEDTQAFHNGLKGACDNYSNDAYDRFKAWADEYFFIPHRNEPRGVGGIFYDYLDGEDPNHFDFTKNVGTAFLETYPKIVAGRMNQPWSAEEREYQLMRRGRYVEFNLIYDRGTQFGLKTGGNPEAILMSLPPAVTWALTMALRTKLKDGYQ